MAQAPRVGVVARDSGDRLRAPTTNTALELADSLRGLNPALNQTLQDFGAQEKAKQEAKARADALKTSGKRFADAVRDGTIRGSQNPWYMAAYNKEAAQLSSRTQLAQLQVDAQQWEERNDPAAFQARWTQEIASLGEQYNQVDQRAGFETEANVASQHVIESNTRLNMNRVEQERGDNLAKLVANAVRDVNAANGGNASPEQIYKGLAEIKAQALSTGGSQQEWDRIVQAGVVSAAYNMQDADLIDVLKFDAEGKGSIYNIAGVADAVEADKFRIRSNADADVEQRLNKERLKHAEEGNKAIDAAFAVFGMDILKGNVDPAAITKSLEGSGFSGRAIAYAFNDIQRTVSDSQSLSRAKLTGNTAVLDLYLKGRQNGYSPALKQDISNAIVSGAIDVNDGIRFIDTALDRSRQGQQDVEADEARSAARAGRESGLLKAQLDNLESLVIVELSKAGARVSSNRRDTFEQAIVDAALSHLSATPDDYTGALLAAQDKAADLLTSEIARRQGASTGGTQTGTQPAQGNPRR